MLARDLRGNEEQLPGSDPATERQSDTSYWLIQPQNTLKRNCAGREIIFEFEGRGFMSA
jgi:hypothetical protein